MLCFALVNNHPFVDGNKRLGHAAMETFLVLNGAEVDAPIGDQEHVMLDLASGHIDRDQLANWLRQRPSLLCSSYSSNAGMSGSRRPSVELKITPSAGHRLPGEGGHVDAQLDATAGTLPS